MIYANSIVFGIDAKIKLLQTYLDTKLKSLWNGSIAIYGRVYNNQKEDGTYPEVWIGNNEYKEIYIDDRYSATVCFIVKERDVKNKGNISAIVDVVFSLNVNKALGSSIRNDEKIMLQIINLLRKSQLAQPTGESNTGVENVYTGYNIDTIKYRDMHPNFIFSIPCKIYYNENLC